MAVDTKLIQQLRQISGAGMMDCKRALEESGGDVDVAVENLRKKGLAKSASREVGSQGTIAIATDDGVAALVEVKCETDFVASSDQFKAFVDDLAQLVLAKGEAAVAERSKELEDLKISLKEGIDLGKVARFEAGSGNALGHYLHVQGGRGVNGVVVELSGASAEDARAIAMHVSFAKPRFLTRAEVPEDAVAKERAVLEEQTRNEGKPEQAIAKIVDGKLNGFFKDVVLLEQPYIQDEKKSVQQHLGSATVVRFAQAYIG